MFESDLLSHINVESPLPHFVEVDLVDSINNSLSKAFHFVHVLLAEKSSTVASLLPWSSEIWLALNTLLEYRLLFHANTTFAEMLFALCRGAIASPTRPLGSQGRLSWWICGPGPIPSLEEQALQSPNSVVATEMNDSILDATDSQLTAKEMVTSRGASYGHLRFRPLTDKQRHISILLITLKPYLQGRAAKWYAEQLDTSPGAVSMRAAYANRYPMRARIKEILKRLYPLFHTLTSSVGLLYQILFLLEYTPYTTVLHRTFGIIIRRLTLRDHLATLNTRAQRILTVARMIFLLLFIGFRVLELTGAGTGGGSSVANMIETDENLAVPRPPVWGVDVEVPAGARTPEPGMCPVCERRVTNAAVCTVSGVVGCYPCLQSYIREHGKCPVTMLKTSLDGIRRIYEC